MEDKYVVIKEKQLRMLMAQLDMSQSERNEAILNNTIPDQQLWDAAEKNQYDALYDRDYVHTTMNDFLTKQFDK